MNRLCELVPPQGYWRPVSIANCNIMWTAGSRISSDPGCPAAEARETSRAGVGRSPHANPRRKCETSGSRGGSATSAYDLRFSARSFLKTPAFTTTAVLSLVARHRGHDGRLLAGRPGAFACPSRAAAGTSGPDRLERRSGRRRFWHLEPHVLSDLPRP